MVSTIDYLVEAFIAEGKLQSFQKIARKIYRIGFQKNGENSDFSL